jgi:hypothetical protein
MTLNVAKELAELRRMSVADLRSRYAEVLGKTTNAHQRDTGQRVATSAGFWACQGGSSAFVGHWNVRERPGRPTTRATLRRLVATLFKHLPGMTWKNVVSPRE